MARALNHHPAASRLPERGANLDVVTARLFIERDQQLPLDLAARLNERGVDIDALDRR